MKLMTKQFSKAEFQTFCKDTIQALDNLTFLDPETLKEHDKSLAQLFDAQHNNVQMIINHIKERMR